VKPIDRLALADIGGNPSRLAEAILAQVKSDAIITPIEDIASALGILEIRQAPLEGAEGVLITNLDKQEGAILINANSPHTRRRFTLAHELGHFVNPWHTPTSSAGFRCTAKDMRTTTSRTLTREQRMEVEANQFAAALLMPQQHIRRFLGANPNFDLTDAATLKDKLEVSLEAILRRLVSLSEEPIAVLFLASGAVRYSIRSSGFPRLTYSSKSFVAELRKAIPESGTSSRVSSWSDVTAQSWAENTFACTIYCQELKQSADRSVVLLSAEMSTSDDECDGSDWEPPRFRR